jgi:hypothetical protein
MHSHPVAVHIGNRIAQQFTQDAILFLSGITIGVAKCPFCNANYVACLSEI